MAWETIGWFWQMFVDDAEYESLEVKRTVSFLGNGQANPSRSSELSVFRQAYCPNKPLTLVSASTQI